jgi:hypothetical protein
VLRLRQIAAQGVSAAQIRKINCRLRQIFLRFQALLETPEPRRPGNGPDQHPSSSRYQSVIPATDNLM